MVIMFLRSKVRRKDGKSHRYWSVVENRRVAGGRVVQKQVLYLGELNDAQRAGWVRTIETFEEQSGSKRKTPRARQLALFPDDRTPPDDLTCEVAQIRLDQIQLRRPRQWGACWLATHLWDMLDLDRFWKQRLGVSRKKTDWTNVLKALCAYRFIAPGSEWRFHREWYDNSAMADLLDEDFSLAQKDKPYRLLDRLLEHRDDLFTHLKSRWGQLFNVGFDVLLYDLTSTYFESDPPPRDSKSKKKFGYSRDHRPDCVQVVIALVVTPEGLPLAYEVYPGNTRDSNTLRDFLKKIEDRYGNADRIWLMDRGIPTEETLKEMRESRIDYLVGTPKGRLDKLEKQLLDQPWIKARDSVSLKVLPQDGEHYVLVKSAARVGKERSMRRRRLKRLWARLHEIRAMKRLSRDELLLKLGGARKDAGRAWSLVSIETPEANQPVNEATFSFSLNREKLRQSVAREGRYLLRAFTDRHPPEKIWEFYLLLTRVEQAFKDLKGDLSVRPIYHQRDNRIEAHIFLSFLAYCFHATLRQMSRGQAGGLTSAAIIEKLQSIQMIDIHLPTTDGRRIVLSRYTEPEPDIRLLLNKLNLTLPKQPPPKVYANGLTSVVPT